MKDVKPAVLNYRIYFKSGDEIDVLDKDNDPNFEDSLLDGSIAVYGHDDKPVPVTNHTVNTIVPIYAQICAHCFSNLNLHFGETLCPDCGECTWMPAPEQ